MMFINNLNKREKTLAIVAVSVVSISIVYALLIVPLFAKWIDLNNQIRSKVNMLESGFKMLANQKQLNEEYAKVSKYAKHMKSDEQAVADTLAYIETLSRNDACLIVNIKPVGTTKADHYKEILIDISAEANMSQFSKFLYDIENPRDTLISVKRFALSPKSGQADILKGTFLISKILLD
ncbi:MAG: hypothetical protein Q8R38_01685 [Candidatus Omnitrophota bacterium]|nr:hypothetical protein [Candidatus Omnitrophota bacterium]